MKTERKIVKRALTFLITVGVAWLAFDAATTHFETVVIAVLALIYGAVRLGGLQQVGHHLAAAIATNHQFYELALQLNFSKMSEYVKSIDRTNEEAKETLKKGQIEGFALGLICLYALYKIVVIT